MMGVYARNGHFAEVHKLFDSMEEHGLQPDLASFNMLINVRTKSSSLGPGLSLELLNEVCQSGLRLNTITYNTLISACTQTSNWKML
jgi:pentatricopeptide repeat protein